MTIYNEYFSELRFIKKWLKETCEHMDKLNDSYSSAIFARLVMEDMVASIEKYIKEEEEDV